ncbi:hypothetical protein EVAR_84880_1 [Eumeta japonica]|uniref:Uncharacterized protein n=1 Tax=Eumeta variegata TaxID=151549 RepID=A0A4C1YEI0_EUMVA|nr:hypothetical protein EVAR_84880_1 [Eumeta japonica]
MAAKVGRVRKTKNQNVVLSCGTKDDLALIRNRIMTNKNFKVEVARPANPLTMVRDVIYLNKDADRTENLLAQHKHLLERIAIKNVKLRIKYEKKTRKPFQCHVMLERLL